MQALMNVINRESHVESLISKINQADKTNYIGEAISQKAHALQCAYFAQTLGHDEEVILAGLLHDIGHFYYSHPLPSMAHLGVVDHEWLGARIALENGFSSNVAELIGLHVNAKRYLTAKKNAYYKQLSSASKETLAFQGGPMSIKEMILFEKHPLFTKALQVRANDEKAKVKDLVTPPLENFYPLIVDHVERNTLHTQAEKQLFFIRHAHAKGQAPEAPLTAAGKKSLGDLVKDLFQLPIDMIITSPFTRARQTAQAIAKQVHHRVFTDHRLQEFNDHTPIKDRLPIIINTLENIQASALNNYVIVTHGNWLSTMIKYLFPDTLFAGVSQLKRPHIIKVTLGNQKKSITL